MIKKRLLSLKPVLMTKDYFAERNRIADAKTVKYLSGIGHTKPSNYDGGEIGSTSGNRKD